MIPAEQSDEAVDPIVVIDRGLEGVLIDRGPGWQAAYERHERLLAALDKAAPNRPAVEIIVRLVTDAPLLTARDLSAATSPLASLYECCGDPCLEWPRSDDGWRDRRQLGHRLVELIGRHGGVRMQPTDWSAAIAFLRAAGMGDLGRRPWRAVIAGAQAWWLDRLPPLLYAHVIDVQRMQPLPRGALARRNTQRRTNGAQ